MKFAKVINTEIRIGIDNNGNVIFIIAKPNEMLEKRIISDTATVSNDKWLAINIKNNKIYEFDSIQSAKNFVRVYYND